MLLTSPFPLPHSLREEELPVGGELEETEHDQPTPSSPPLLGSAFLQIIGVQLLPALGGPVMSVPGT